jgi:hypothetical protein
MPTEGAERTLGAYVGELVAILADSDPAAFVRLRAIVAGYRGRIGLDDEVVEVFFNAAGMSVMPAPSGLPVHGEGSTDRATVCAILDGTLELTDAILSGHLQVRGDCEAAMRLFAAIDILLDGSTRIPQLQHLAHQFRDGARKRHAGGKNVRPPALRPGVPFGPGDLPVAEEALLRRSDLWSI